MSGLANTSTGYLSSGDSDGGPDSGGRRSGEYRVYSPMRGTNTLWSLLKGEQLLMFTGTIFVLFIGISITSYYGSRELNSCLGAPYLYVSYGIDHNIFQITRDGCVTMNKVLYRVPRKKVELRSMAIADYKGAKSLYVADAARNTNSVLVFGECSYWSKMRTLATRKMDSHSFFREGAIHAYGMTFDNNGNLYVSYQHTNVILRSTKDTFEPMPLPGAMQRRQEAEGLKLYEGTFYQFGQPMIQESYNQGVRSIAWASNNEHEELLWVANEFENAVYILDQEANLVKKLEITKPIGLYHSKGSTNPMEMGRIYIGSRGKNKLGNVFCFDTNTLDLLATYSMIGMTHPTGIAVHEDTLYVADQTLNSILSFDLVTGRYIASIWDRDEGNIEQIVLSDC